MDEVAMDGGVMAEAVMPPQPQHPTLEEATVEKPVVVETCVETDRLLAADDSSEELVPAAEGEAMEVSVEESAVDASEPIAENPAQEVAQDEEMPEMSVCPESAVTVDEPQHSTPPQPKPEQLAINKHSVESTPTNNAAKDLEAEQKELKEHSALADERAWYGELPSFVKKIYGLAEDADDSPTATAFPVCSHCCADGKPRAMASVCCQEPSCPFRGMAVCSACFPHIHTTAADRTHPQQLTKACPHCHLNRVSDWCVGCDLSFCAECYSATHDNIKRVSNHRKFSLNGTTGDMLIRAKWTPHFRNVIMQLQLEQRQQLAAAQPLASATTSNGAQQPSALKRKRSDEPPDIICIEENSSDSDKATRQSQQPLSTSYTAPFATAASMAPAWTQATGFYAPPSHLRPLAPATSLDMNGFSRGTTPELTHSFVSATSTPVAGMPVSHTTYSQHTTSAWQVPITNHTYVVPPTPTPTPPTTTVAIPSTAGRVPLPDNPIENVMFERLNQLSQRIVQTEEEVATINRQVVQASYQSVVNAHNMMGQLENAQQRLRQLTTKRDVTVVHLVAQSKSIISKVKQLRIDLLGDIAQVHAASYRRCLQLSSQIAEAEAGLADMNQRMQTTLDHISVMSSEVFHRAVTSLSTAIQAQHQTIANYKEERENEVVRLVQYHSCIRETLKRAVQQNQRRRQQQSQSLQPTQAPITPSQPMPATSYPMMMQPQQSLGLYPQYQQQQQQQFHQQPQAPSQLQPLGYNNNDASQQRDPDTSVDLPISPPPFA